MVLGIGGVYKSARGSNDLKFGWEGIREISGAVQRRGARGSETPVRFEDFEWESSRLKYKVLTRGLCLHNGSFAREMAAISRGIAGPG